MAGNEVFLSFDSIFYYFFLYALFFLFRSWPGPRLLLLASLVFYASFNPRNLLLLAPMAAVSYFGGIFLYEARRWRRAKLALHCGLVFMPLLACKCLWPRWALPLGISFYTFHCASYLIDAYRRVIKPERAFRKVFLYISFFPQLVAGPITRASEILPQLEVPRQATAGEIRLALWRIYLGLFKKFAIANVLAAGCLRALAQPWEYPGQLVLAAILAGRYYIYADFSGYTDIAIGSAQLLGIKLPENFRRPFAAPSLAEYWRRWHMTLQSWIRDYVFFPLSTSLFSVLGVYPLLIFTFALLGLWHGVSLNFLIYGLWHGGFLSLLDSTRSPRARLWRKLGLDAPWASRWICPWVNFLVFVCPPTVFFLTKQPADALAVIRGLANTGGVVTAPFITAYHRITVLAAVLLLEGFQWLGERRDCLGWIAGSTWPRFTLGLILALLFLAVAGEFGGEENFLYFRY